MSASQDTADGVALCHVVAGRHTGVNYLLHPGWWELGDGAPSLRDSGDGATWAIHVDEAGRIVAQAAVGVEVDGLPLSEALVVGDELFTVDGQVLRFTPPMAETPDWGPTVLDRLPRSGEPAGSCLVERPPPETTIALQPLLIATMMTPLVIGAVTGLLISPWLLLLGTMTPILFVVRSVESRQFARVNEWERSVQLAEYEDRLAEAHCQARRDARRRWPDICELGARSHLAHQRLWERRATDDDALVVTMRFDAVEWPGVALDGHDVDPVAAAYATVGPAPVIHDLIAPVGLVGPDRDDALRSVLLQLVTLNGPADLAVHLLVDRHLGDRGSPYAWMTGLPHAITCCVGERGDDHVLATRLARPGRHVVVVDTLRTVDLDRLPAAAVVLGEDAIGLPASVATVFDSAEPGMCLVDMAQAEAVAVDLGRVIDPDAGPLRLGRGLDLACLSSPGRQPLVAPIGETEVGVLTLDLTVDEPHLVISGVGSTHALDHVVAALAESASTAELEVITIGEVGADLPHTVAALASRDRYQADRMVQGLLGELRSRRVSHPGSRLLVVVDAIDDVARELPALAEAVEFIAKEGPPAGIHIVCSSWTPRVPLPDCQRIDLDGVERHPVMCRSGASVRVAVCATGARGVLDRLHAGVAPLARWAPSLPREVGPDELGVPAREFSVPFALGDEPDRHCHSIVHLDAGIDGALLCGAQPAMTSRALQSAVISLARHHDPTRLHLYVVDGEAGRLKSLRDLPHVGMYIEAGDADHRDGLLVLLEAEMHRRVMTDVAEQPLILVAIDEAPRELESRLACLMLDGPALGLCVITASTEPLALPGRKFVFQMQSPDAYAALDLEPALIPPLGGMRAVDVRGDREVVVADPWLGDPATAVAELIRRNQLEVV